MHEQTYIVKVKVDSKSNSRLGSIERLLVKSMDALQMYGNVDISVHTAVGEIPLKCRGQKLVNGGHTSFIPINSKGKAHTVGDTI